MKLSDIIVESAYSGLNMIDYKTCTMPSGHNGLKYDLETPVRNNGQWAILFFNAYKISGDRKFFDAAVLLMDYFFSKEARPMNATFWHRKNPEKDACNGVIGSAFSIEALITAFQNTGDSRYKDLASEVFLLHPFDEKKKIWKITALPTEG